MVVDTSIFIEFLRAKDKTKSILYSISNVRPLAISSITLYELMMGATNNNKLNDIKLLTDDLIILDFDARVAKKSSEIYHQLRLDNKMIEFRDIFIGATCIVNQMPIKTLNVKHFERIKELKIS
jgi:tRNA(fMet)-specific endonuclease VapC